MIKYPIKKELKENDRIKSTANRGMNLESMINRTNKFYVAILLSNDSSAPLCVNYI